MKSTQFLTVTIFISFLFQTAFSGPIAKTSADLVARNFLLSQGNSAFLKSAGNEIVCKTYGKLLSSDGMSAEQPAFYVYNMEKPGFVIVSGHDALPPILAYSNENPFNFSNTSSGLEALFKDYEMAINYAARNDLKPSAQVKAEWDRYFQYNEQLKTAYLIDSIKHITTTKWGYGSPYNNLCPADPNASVRNGGRCPVGCAAVAMAQVLKYWNDVQKTKVNIQQNIWYQPLKGYGSNSYPSNYGTLSANFGNTVYQWDTMPNELTTNSSGQEKLAVATLMYHCGISVDMEYSYNSSGCFMDCYPEPISNTNCVKKAFQKFWGFRNTIKGVEKNFPDSIWEDMVKKEIIAGRPVIYAGEDGTSNAAHAMVIDGFNKAGHLSINWGLFGNNNGYFRLNFLPLPVSETLVFNYINNGMIMTGIEPEILVSAKETGWENHLRIWPNPASDRLHVDLSGFRESRMDIDILNGSGVKVSGFTYTGTPTEIPLENLNPGIYFIRVKTRNQEMTKKFIVE